MPNSPSLELYKKCWGSVILLSIFAYVCTHSRSYPCSLSHVLLHEYRRENEKGQILEEFYCTRILNSFISLNTFSWLLQSSEYSSQKKSMMTHHLIWVYYRCIVLARMEIYLSYHESETEILFLSNDWEPKYRELILVDLLLWIEMTTPKYWAHIPNKCCKVQSI